LIVCVTLEFSDFLLTNVEDTFAFLSFVCPKERNKEKGSQKQKLRCFWQANAHGESLFFVITFFYWGDRLKLLLRIVRDSKRRCLFRLDSL